MDYTDYDCTITVDLGDFGNQDFDVSISVSDEWMVEQVFDQELYSTEQIQYVLDNLDEDTKVKLLAESLGIDLDK